MTSIKGEKFLLTLPNVYAFYVRGTVRVRKGGGVALGCLSLRFG